MIDGWTVQLHENPFPDAWPLGILLATALLSLGSLD